MIWNVGMGFQPDTRISADLFSEGLSGALLLVNPTGEIRALNPSAEKFFGYTSGELLGRSIDLLMPGTYLSRHHRHMRNYWQSPAAREMRAENNLIGQRKDGTRFAIAAFLIPLVSSEGFLVLCILRDSSSSTLNHRDNKAYLFMSAEKERFQLARGMREGPLEDLNEIYIGLKKQMEAGIQIDEPAHLLELTAAIHALRSITAALHPSILFSEGLEKAIWQTCQAIHQSHRGLNFHLDLTPDGQNLNRYTRLVLFRAFQQVISNVVRHAGATRVQILFVFDKERIILEVIDNGCGFEVPNDWEDLAVRGQYGLMKTALTVHSLDGRITVNSSPGKGTTVTFSIPNRENVELEKELMEMLVA